jgi:hypothetical protein
LQLAVFFAGESIPRLERCYQGCAVRRDQQRWATIMGLQKPLLDSPEPRVDRIRLRGLSGEAKAIQRLED